MMNLKAIVYWTVAAALLWAPTASASSSITVVTHEEEEISSALVDGFYNALRTQIELHPDWRLNDVPRQSLQDVTLALGCMSLDADCAEILQEVTGSDYIAWAEISVGDSTTDIVLHLYDLDSAEDFRVRRHSLRGSERVATENAALLARSLLYPDTQSLQIASEPSGARVMVNGEDVGVTPITVDELPIGLVDVEVSYPDYRTRSEAVAVDIGENEVSWTLVSGPVERERRTRERTTSDGQISPAIGWTVAGIGGAALIGGVVAGILTSSTQNEFDEELASGSPDLQRAADLRDRGQAQARASNALLITGGVLALTGTTLILVSNSQRQRAQGDISGDTAQALRPAPELSVAPRVGVGSAGLEFDLRF